MTDDYWFAFLRAINVGGRTVKMDRLRDLLSDLGLCEVQSYIASGNLYFRAPQGPAAEWEQRIEKQLQATLGFTVETFIRSGADLRTILECEPFPGESTDGATLYVSFLREPPTAEEAQAVAALSLPTDLLRVHGRELYWLCRTRISDSPITARMMERAYRGPSTMRNISTVRKLVERTR